MGILLYSEAPTATVGLSPASINGVPIHYRTYQAQEHYLLLEGSNADVLSHDAQKILALQGFRLATAEEQDARNKPPVVGLVKEEQRTTSKARR